ncbi:hypothetical protein [Archaeoglobus neptunius]|uniref:hypothetical protein n=1 Tax=Archaeoglobus neptunius TaxID=2798580 RepID=UPI001925DD84|nr:hypothetical protein [Archaeoglobus neptunius]
MIQILNLLIAEIAAYYTYEQFVSSPLRFFIPYPAEILLFAIPLIGMLFRRPFSFYYYIFLVFFNISPFLPASETFEGVIDTLYALGFSGIAESIYGAFSNFSGTAESLLIITWLYITSEVIQGNYESIKAAKENGVTIEGELLTYAPAIAFSLLILLIYPAIASIGFEVKIDRIIAGLIGIAAFFAGAYILAKSVEEENINSAK